jgi:hypothetical protein
MVGRPRLRPIENPSVGAVPAQPEHHPQPDHPYDRQLDQRFEQPYDRQFDPDAEPRSGPGGQVYQLFQPHTGPVTVDRPTRPHRGPAAEPHPYTGPITTAQPYTGSITTPQPYTGAISTARPGLPGQPASPAPASIRAWRLPVAGRTVRAVRAVVLVTLGSAAASWLVGRATQSIAGNKMAPWILGRASGITAYLLMVLLVALGLVLSHPWRARFRRPSSTQRIRAHISLAVFTLAFLVLHIVVLATDQYAKVGWWGALLPMASQFRPVAVTLGVIGAYSGLLAGITAALAGRWARRVWWPIHKVAAISLVLVWAHGVMAGADTPTLLWFYLVTAAGILALAASRYIVRTPGDRVRDLIESELPRAGSDR